MRHPNLLIYLGSFDSPTLGHCIITEYIDGGSLRSYLSDPGRRLSWQERLDLAVQTARGLAWLHSRDPPILHRDLHTNNILVNIIISCNYLFIS